MKILVAVKQVIDYRVKVRLKADKSGVETQSVKQSMNPFDEIALEEALRLQEKGVASEVIAVSCGSRSCQDVLRAALAMGATQAVQVETESELAPVAVAKALAALVKQQGIDLVLLGKQAIDNDCNQVGQLLAGYLSWPQATFVSQLTCENEGLIITREVDAGLETVAVSLPAVVSADLRLNTPRFVSLPNIMKAKAKKTDTVALADLGVDAASKIRHVSYELPPQRQAGKKVQSLSEIMDVIKEQVA